MPTWRDVSISIAMEGKDVIDGVVIGFDLSFETSEDALGSCADLSILPGWVVWWWLSQYPGFPCSQGHGSCCQSAPQTESPPVGKGVPVAGLTSSPVSLAGWMVPRGPASPFACLLFHPICSGSSLHVEVIVYDTVLSTA